jgi:hypothetical protein
MTWHGSGGMPVVRRWRDMHFWREQVGKYLLFRTMRTITIVHIRSMHSLQIQRLHLYEGFVNFEIWIYDKSIGYNFYMWILIMSNGVTTQYMRKMIHTALLTIDPSSVVRLPPDKCVRLRSVTPPDTRLPRRSDPICLPSAPAQIARLCGL